MGLHSLEIINADTIKEKALFTHCYTYSLNLAVGDAIKNSEIMKEALETTYVITKLIKKSPRRE